VSPALATHRRLVLAVPLAVVGAAVGAAAVLAPRWDVPGWVVTGAAVAAVLLVAAAGWLWWWAERNRRSWGWAEAEDDLLVTSGLMFRRLVVVPYGRIQYVDVEAGPVERRLGITRVSLHTASTETAATVPGVPADEARRLRDRLTDLGRAHDAGV
jgi:membrane protein YdbS with pleckstrin-like domain